MGAITTGLSPDDAWRTLFQTQSGRDGGAIQVEGKWFFRRDVVVAAIQTAAGDVAGHLDATGTPHASYELIRALELGEAGGPQQLAAAIALRLLQPEHTQTDPFLRRLSLMRCIIDAHTDGNVSSQFIAKGVLPSDVPGLLVSAIATLQDELRRTRSSRAHTPPEQPTPAVPVADYESRKRESAAEGEAEHPNDRNPSAT